MDHQTFAQILGNYGEFVGAIAVVITLIYLAIQIKDSARAASAQTNHSIARSLNELNIAVATDNSLSEIIARGVQNNSSLSLEERIRFGAFFNAILQSYQDMFVQHTKGFDDQDLWQAAIPFIERTFSTKEMRGWWNSQGREIVLPAFANEIDSLLSSSTNQRSSANS